MKNRISEKQTQFHRKSASFAERRASIESVKIQLYRILEESTDCNEKARAINKLVILNGIYFPINAKEVSEENQNLLLDNCPEVDANTTAIFQLNEAMLCLLDGKFPSVQAGLDLTLPILESYQEELLVEVANSHLAGSYLAMGHAEKAMQVFLKCLGDSVLLRDPFYILVHFFNMYSIASIYFAEGKSNRAMMQLDRIIALMEEYHFQDAHLKARVYNLMGNIYFSKEQHILAKDYLEKAYFLSEEYANESAIYPRSIHDLGRLSEELKDFEAAEKKYQESYEIRKLLNLKDAQITSLISMANLSIRQGEFHKAKKYAQEGLGIAGNLSSKKKYLDLLKISGDLAERSGEFEKALIYFQQHQSLEKELFDQNAKDKLYKLQVMFDLQSEQEENQSLKHKNEQLRQKQEEILQQQESIRRQNQELQRINKELVDSFSYARRIQETFLTSEEKIKSYFKEQFIIYLPKHFVSGDFYWAAKQPDGSIFFAMGDCTGHGVSGAFMAVSAMAFLNQAVNIEKKTMPSEILQELHKNFSKMLHHQDEISSDGMDMALVKIDSSSKEIVFAGAKASIYLSNEDSLSQFKGNKNRIGGLWRSSERIFTDQIIPSKHLDMVYMHSDGFVDQFGGQEKKKFGKKRLEQLLRKVAGLSCYQQHSIILQQFELWKRREHQIDDVTFVGIRL